MLYIKWYSHSIERGTWNNLGWSSSETKSIILITQRCGITNLFRDYVYTLFPLENLRTLFETFNESFYIFLPFNCSSGLKSSI